MSIKNTKRNGQSIYYIKYVTCAKVLQDLNSASDFDSTSESDNSESDFSSVFINLDICIFLALYLHSSK